LSETFSPEALDAFVADLRASGYTIDVGQVAAVQYLALLSASGSWPRPHELGTVLAPIFARTPTEQFDIGRRLQAWEPLLFPSLNGSDRPDSVSGSTPLRSVKLMATPDSPGGAIMRRYRLERRWVVILSAFVLLAGLGLMGLVLSHEWSSGVAPVVSVPRGLANERVIPAPSQTFFQPRIGHSKITMSESGTLISGRPVMPVWSIAIPIVTGGMPVALVLGIWLLRRSRWRAWRYLAEGSPRDVAEMQVLMPDTPLFEGLVSELGARDLARPRRVASNELDLDRSLDATARAAGIPQPVFKVRPQTPSYVIVVEEASRHDHLARLGDILGARLADAGVVTESYHMTHPEIVRTTDGRNSYLDEVGDRHRGARLLVLGPGELILDPRSRRVVRALSENAAWSDRAYLVLGRIDRLTAQKLLDDGFVLAPATPTGMREFGKHIASAPRQFGQILMTLPGAESRSDQNRDAVRPLPRPWEQAEGGDLAEVHSKLVATLRGPLLQLVYILQRRSAVLDEGANRSL
jgi:hypothetical protein